MSNIFIEPGRSNTSGEDEGHWKIMIDENGKVRHLNDGKSKADATEKAHRAASKRNIEFDGQGVTPSVTRAETPQVVKKDYMDVLVPRGAPALGATVQHKVADEVHEGKVVDYLAEQFVIEYQMTTTRVVHMNEDWTVI